MSKQLEATTSALADLGTKMADLQAKGFANADAPQRQTISPAIAALLAKTGLTAEAEKGQMSVEQVDKMLEAQGVRGEEAIKAKLNLRHAGLMVAGKR